jgi:DNA ligase-associated metallophosphoesterase
MTAAPIHLAGERLMLDPSGIAFWPAQSLLIVSDLHLEKGSALARKGQLVPPFDSAATLERLALRVRAWQPRAILALGDSFHDPEGALRLAEADTARLAAIAKGRDLIWVLGNHDPAPPQGLPGTAVTEYAAGRLIFRHQSVSAAKAEISGHYHPKASAPTRGGGVSRPCFVADSNRLLMPAFGAYTGGLDIRSPAITALFPRLGIAFLLGRERLFSFTLANLRAAQA